ncbi:MAG TPA: radical SAM family heme chaperone HemW [Stellaceae bacterium]|nr:radical SAM family heme chaperone HemW [Stellaceae bacterium]
MPRPPPLAVYIHWPFCRSKCPYCDFNSHVRERIDARAWTTALVADLDRQAELVPDREVVSIFFGGGTPSLMPPDTAAALIERVKRHWRTAHELEITLEANPNSAEAQRFAGFAAAGINRLSLGIQALRPDALKFLGRAHDRDEALAAIRLSRQLFTRTSFDLIYARPQQTLDAWSDELDEALALAGEHLSLYQLTIEPGTAFHTRAKNGELRPLDDETAAAMFEVTQERLAASGRPAYEISNHARPGGECRHNLAYWRYEDYLGVGPGAHGRITRGGVRYATRQRRLPEAWLRKPEFEEMTPIGRESAIEEMVMMGLRLTEGVSRARLEALANCDIKALFGISLARLIGGGFIALDNERFRATEAGRQRLNAVLGALFG